MFVTFFGGYYDFLSDSYFGPDGYLDLDLIDATSTEFVLNQIDYNITTTYSGTGFVFNNGAPVAGTINEISFEYGNQTIAEITDVAWSLTDFDAALSGIENNDHSLMAALFSQSPITIDASGASSSLWMNDWWSLLPYITTTMEVIGSDHNDLLFGGPGNDTITPGQSDGYDELRGSAGDDLYDFGNADADTFAELIYANLAAPIMLEVNGTTGMGSVASAVGTDTLTNMVPTMSAPDGGMGFIGTRYDDTFDLSTGPNGWVELGGGAGNDTFRLVLDGTVRLIYNWDGLLGPTQGIVMNLETGVVSNDGFGDADLIQILEGDGRLEIRGTDFDDRIFGSDRDERFILQLGDDTLNGGGGWDTVRYDRSGIDMVDANLGTGIATGIWSGNTFTHHLTNIEEVRGSYGDDVLTGNAEANRLEGRDGNDTLVGQGGADRLFGGNGDDVINTGTGRDSAFGGDGNDFINASQGDFSTDSYGDYIEPGTGQDTIMGSADLWADGEGLDLSYGGLWVGGMVINVDSNGAGTAVSNSPGAVNDSFTYVNYVLGSMEGDLIRFGDTTGFFGTTGLQGDDTIRGGAGFNQINYLFDDSWGGTAGINARFTLEGQGTVTDTFGDTDTFSGVEGIRGTAMNDVMIGADGYQRFEGEDGNDRLLGNGGNDELYGGDGRDTLSGGDGDDTIYGGATEADRGDVIYGGDGHDEIDAGWGNDEVSAGSGNDTVVGGYGVDTLIGNEGDDRLDGGVNADILYGNDGNDFFNGGFANDRYVGGTGADTFFHTGTAQFATDWIQDYSAAEGDLLQFGGVASIGQFQVNTAHTPAGDNAVDEAFIVYRPTGQILWALVDGAGQDHINMLLGGVQYDLMA